MPGSEVIDLTSLSDSDTENAETRHVDDNDKDSDSERTSEVSEETEIEITLNAETRAQLQRAIATISETHLRRLLTQLVETDITMEAVLSRELLTLPSRSQNVVPRWETCANCNGEYDIGVTQRASSCVFHPGDLEVCEETFADWDEDVHGPMDSSINRREYPENFLWSCCEHDGTSDGCVRGKHHPAVPRKRKRLGS